MQQLYTSAEAARLIGVSDGTVRSWLSRHSECFEVGKHIVEQDGKRLWTEEGLQLLRTRASENATSCDASSDAGAVENATSHDASFNADGKALHVAMLDSFVEQTAQELATTFWKELPSRTLQHIQRMMHEPKPKEREIVLMSMQQVMELLPSSQGKHMALPQAQTEGCL